MNKKIFVLLLFAVLFIFTVSQSIAGILPMRSFGHGVVCSKNVCMFVFPKKVNVISIYKYQCRPEDKTYCRSAFYIDLGGHYLNMPVFRVKDNNPSNFFYSAVVASHYDNDKKKGIRRFVMEFKTKQLPQIIWDFKTSTIEVVNNDESFKDIVIPKTRQSSKKEASNTQPKQVKVPVPVKAQVPKTTQQLSSAQEKQPKEKKSVKPTVKSIKDKSVVFKKKKKIIVSKKGGKININFRNIKLRKSVLKAPPPKKIKVKSILTFEQMGDTDFKSGHYTRALVWYKKALENVKDTQDRLRITDKIIAVTTFLGGKK